MNSHPQVLFVGGKPPKIHFEDKSIPPISYSLKNLMNLPVHSAKRAIEMAEISYMNKHFQNEVLQAVNEASSVVCIGVFEGRVTWKAESCLYGYEWYVTTDIEGSIIPDLGQS